MVYPVRDFVEVGYLVRIRAAVDKVATQYREMILRAEPLIRDLMVQYKLDLPTPFSAFVEAQRLTHIKVGEDWIETICGTCPFFPDFSLNATLNDEVEISDVWFDG